MSELRYRGEQIWRGDFTWTWGCLINAWYRLAFPLCWRFRSDEEAIRILCERVDEHLDQQERLHALTKQRQEALAAREAALQDLEGEL